MNRNEIDCLTAVFLRNQTAPLTFEEERQLQTHLESCYECREEQILCLEALDLIDHLPPSVADAHPDLNLHVSRCMECRAAKIVEADLRTVIAPVILPAPSLNFEAMLAAELSIDPAPVIAPLTVTARPLEDKITRWSWAVSAITFALIIAVQIPKSFTLIANLPGLGMRFLAFLASQMTGETAVVYSQLKRAFVSSPTETLGVLMGITLLVISIAATRTFSRQEF